MTQSGESVTVLLDAVSRGDVGARDRLIAVAYDEVRATAQRLVAGRDGGDGALHPTAIVGDVYLRLFGGTSVGWENRQHFFFCVARAIRDLIAEHARARSAKKRGGDRERVVLDERFVGVATDPDSFLEVDAALDRLRSHDPVCADVVFLRCFAGLGHAQVAETLGVSEARVRRDWSYAKAWLRRDLT